MQLTMYLGNDLIDSVPVDIHLLSQPGYLGKFKRVLKNKHAGIIQESRIQPEFLVVDLKPESPSKNMNTLTGNGQMHDRLDWLPARSGSTT